MPCAYLATAWSIRPETLDRLARAALVIQARYSGLTRYPSVLTDLSLARGRPLLTAALGFAIATPANAPAIAVPPAHAVRDPTTWEPVPSVYTPVYRPPRARQVYVQKFC